MFLTSRISMNYFTNYSKIFYKSNILQFFIKMKENDMRIDQHISNIRINDRNKMKTFTEGEIKSRQKNYSNIKENEILVENLKYDGDMLIMKWLIVIRTWNQMPLVEIAKKANA